MLTIGHYTDAKQLVGYFDEHLKSGDYYTEKDQIEGRWIGRMTEKLGLKELQAVKKEEFEALVLGKHPKTGAKLLIGAKKNRRIAFDMAFSAPKTVSLLALTMGDRRLVEAHHKAVAVGFRQMERLAQTRVRKALSRQTRENRYTENLVAAQFTHTSSRELDPQLHTHHIVFNITHDAAERRIKALEAHEIYMGTKLVSEVYRNALAKEVRALGYEIEPGEHTWRIKGVPREVETRFSKRAAQIEAKSKEFEEKTGLVLNTRGKALISLETRSSKNKEIQDAELVDLQRSQLSKDELAALDRLVQKTSEPARTSVPEGAALSRSVPSSTPAVSTEPRAATSSQVPRDLSQEELAKIAIQYAFENVFERKSILHQSEVLRAALKFSAGRVDFETLEAELKSPQFIHRADGMVTTREERKRELQLLQHVRNGKREFDPLGNSIRLPGYLSAAEWESAAPVVQQSHLSPERWNAAATLLKSMDRYLFLDGAAGVGKTSTLQHLLRAVDAPKVLFSAPTSGAAKKLRDEGFATATTIQKLLLNEREQRALAGALLVVDEAGLLSTRQMKSLFQLAEKYDARVLLVGDTKQHNSVEAGDALRLLQDYSIITRAEIRTIVRQKAGPYRNAIQALSRGDVESGFDILRGMNAIHQADRKKRPAKVASEYVEKVQAGIDTIVVTPTWDEHRDITDAVRETLKKAGILGSKDHTLGVYKSTNFTNVEKRYAPNLTEGLYLSFHADRDEFKQGGIHKILSHDERTVTVEDSSGQRRTIKPKEYATAYDVVAREERQFARNEKILLKANYATSPTNRIPNGSVKTIVGFDPDGTIRLDGGNHLEPGFKMFTHGYAVTSPAAQGKDAKHVIISANAKATGALSMNQFYVSASRGKESISLYTSNIAKFRRAVARPADRELALQHFMRTGPLKMKLERLRVSAERRIEAGRDLIERAFVKYRDSRFTKAKQRSITHGRDLDSQDAGL